VHCWVCFSIAHHFDTCNVVSGHQYLTSIGVLHRDISENNIVLARRPGEERGYLIDLDMAILQEPEKPTEATVKTKRKSYFIRVARSSSPIPSDEVNPVKALRTVSIVSVASVPSPTHPYPRVQFPTCPSTFCTEGNIPILMIWSLFSMLCSCSFSPMQDHCQRRNYAMRTLEGSFNPLGLGGSLT
jgi:serine/threonine protein kinase